MISWPISSDIYCQVSKCQTIEQLQAYPTELANLSQNSYPIVNTEFRDENKWNNQFKKELMKDSYISHKEHRFSFTI